MIELNSSDYVLGVWVAINKNINLTSIITVVKNKDSEWIMYVINKHYDGNRHTYKVQINDEEEDKIIQKVNKFIDGVKKPFGNDYTVTWIRGGAEKFLEFAKKSPWINVTEIPKEAMDDL